MADLYALDATAAQHVAQATRLAQDVAAAEAADVDARGRFPQESVAGPAQGGFFGLNEGRRSSCAKWVSPLQRS